MMRKGLLLVLLSTGLGLLGACSDDGSGTNSSGNDATGGTGTPGGSGPGGTGGTGGPGGGGAPGEFTIDIVDFAYSPEQLTVPAGATVTVRNSGTAPHSVTSGTCVQTTCTESDLNGVGFDTGIIEPGASATFTIPADAASGTEVPYFCVVSPGVGTTPAAMRNLGSIIVE
jgi:plastocyanin